MWKLGSLRISLGWVALFFAWGFVIHGALMVVHEVFGHGAAGTIVGCGIDRIELTYFGPAITYYTPCPKSWRWTLTRRVLVDSAGLAVTICAGAVAMAFQRRAALTSLTRLLLALLATWFLLGQLAYLTWGGFHDVEDPALVARSLAERNIHVLAWLPPLLLYALSAAFGGRAIVDSFRKHFGSRSRLHALKQMMVTLGAAGLLYFMAFYIERTIRIAINAGRALSIRFEQSAAAPGAAARSNARPFPIHLVLLAIAIASFAVALARPVVRDDILKDATPMVSRRHAIGIAIATLVFFVVITLVTPVRMH